ncbi:helix-turn-helix domain-containing protein [Actinoallomurus oryzae]|uniref:helix-turn-helix domain-containing protein n=1 Tax=Actinoallomurus oryzae TaxID=502180 RepID=UPI0031E58368
MTRPDGLERLLRWLARRVSGPAVLLDRAGVPRHAFPGLPEDVIEQASADVERVVNGEARAAAADIGTGVVHIQAIGERTRDAVLVVARPEPFSSATRAVIGDASRLLALRWRAEDLGRRRHALDEAEAHAREAVLHLLLVGELQAARRVAETMGPSLADEIRVYVVEGPPERRDESAAQCDRASGGRAWVVRCPIYTGHVIALAPAPEPAGVMEGMLRRYAARSSGVAVGRGDTVPLPEMASGYGQAFHALAVARGNAEHYAVFSPRGDLAALIRPRGHAWARGELAPLHDYRPSRVQDPDAAELTATLGSWLDFYGGAARQLKIHRNTLAARLRRIEELLGRDLDDLETQARLHLALRVLDGRGRIGVAAPLETILRTPDVRHWAEMQLSPLASRPLLETLRVWLGDDARLEATAAALGISAPGARKRLTRIEGLVGRSLLNGPSARYDLWFALKVHDS